MSLETPDKIRNLQRKLYLKAKAEPDYRFYLLYDKIYRDDILHHAYDLMRTNNGAPGVDGMTFEKIEEDGARGVAGRHQEGPDREDVSTSTGATGDDPEAWEATASDRSEFRPYGTERYRPRPNWCLSRSLKRTSTPVPMATARNGADTTRSKEVHTLICRGYTDVVDADLSKYFDTIPHRELMQSVARRIVDRNVLRLIKMWLKTPVEERDDDGKRRMSGGRHSTCGLRKAALSARCWPTST